LLFILPGYAAKFPGFVSFAVVDTFTGKVQRIFLEPDQTRFDEQKLFKIKIGSIEADDEVPSIAWVDVEIYYNPSKTDVPICVQRGKLCTTHIYRMANERYLIGFCILPYVDEDAYPE